MFPLVTKRGRRSSSVKRKEVTQEVGTTVGIQLLEMTKLMGKKSQNGNTLLVLFQGREATLALAKRAGSHAVPREGSYKDEQRVRRPSTLPGTQLEF
jgi:hypothetical protein